MLLPKIHINSFPCKVIKIFGFSAITLHSGIHLVREELTQDKKLMRHEMCHYRQVSSLGYKFYFLYLKEYCYNLIKYKKFHKAYLEISFEIEARESESRSLVDGTK